MRGSPSKRRGSWILTLIWACLGTSWAAPHNIRVSGSTSVTPIISKAAEAYKRTHPGVNILVSPTGSGAGIQSLAQGTADIAMISRDVDPSEREKYPKTRFNVIPVARDAVAPVVSAAVYDAGVTALSLEDLRRIYSGEATNWKMFGGPDREILVIDKEASRGTRHVFMGAVFGDEKAAAKGARLVTGSNNEEQTAVDQSDSAVGMLSNAWMNEKVRGIGIKKDGKVIEPTPDNVRRGIYPISRNLSLVTNGEPAGFAAEFIQYVLGPEGQKIARELEYAPVR